MNHSLKNLFVVIFVAQIFFSAFFVDASFGDFPTCAICLEGLDYNSDVALLECGHRFHSDCIGRWFSEKKHINCPLCRVDKFSSPEEGLSNLIDACDNWDVELLKKLIEMGANVNGQDSVGNTPLHAACLISDNEIRFNVIRVLLESGVCNFEINNHNRYTALMLLALTDKIDSIVQIINYCLFKVDDSAYLLSGEHCCVIIQLLSEVFKSQIAAIISVYKQEVKKYGKRLLSGESI